MEHRKKKKSIFPVAISVILILAVGCGVMYFGYEEFIRWSHPIKYENYVIRYAAQNNIDKHLVYAVIKTESSFDPTAVSNVGARGLMQITEPTFDWIKFKLGDKETIYHDMFDPKTNIEYGSYLLGYLYDEFGNVETAMAAYHAGRGQVNEWLSDKDISSDGVHLDHIPIPDTAHYVDKIVKALKTYKDIYA